MPGDEASSGTDPEPPLAAQSDVSDELLKRRLYRSLFPSLSTPLTRVGRFVLLRELGRGGMGKVFSAYDEQLDRKVAIKLLHPEVARDDASRARLLREARALARLSHPNVVQVHEAGVHEGQVFVVMEHVEGLDLRRWLEQRAPQSDRRRWRAVLQVLLAAGEGLAAAHEAGLTHRDFKPDNVLVGDDGRVRVADFGLATELDRTDVVSDSADAGDGGPVAAAEPGDEARPLERLTRTGAAVGTVRYMSLQQLRGEPTDASGDQFALCVTLYEALFLELPFPGETRGDVERALEQGEPRVPAAMATVPRWLRRVLWRGLARDAADRYPSLRALLTAIERPHRARRLGALSAAALVMVGAGLGLGLGRSESAVAEDPCAEAGRGIAITWPGEAQPWLAEAQPAEPAAFARESIAGWAERWQRTAVTACEQVHVEGLASEQSLDARRSCLDQQRQRLDHALELLRRAPALRGAQVVDVLGALPEPSDCLLDRADPLAGRTELQRSTHRQLSDRLLELETAYGALDLTTRRLAAREVYDHAEREQLDEVRARAAYLLGMLSVQAADFEATARWLGVAVDLAELVELDVVRGRAWLGLAESALLFHLDEPRARWSWARAEAMTRGLPHPHLLHGLLAHTRALIELEQGNLAAATSGIDTALTELVAVGPTADRYRARTLELAGLLANRRGDHDGARERFAEALAVSREGGGGDDREGHTLFAQGIAELDDGRLEAARESLTRALSLLEGALGPRAPIVADVHVALSAVTDALGDLPAARAHAEAADAIVREIGGPADPDRLYALSALGVASFRAERYAQAAEELALARQIAERVPSLSGAERALLAVDHAEALHAQGRSDEAAPLLVDAIAVIEAEHGPDHVDLALAYEVLGAVRLAQKRTADAEPLLRRAIALHTRHGDSPVELAESRWRLAQCLIALGRDAEAVVEARAAADGFASLGESWSSRRAEIETWIVAR